MSNIWHDISPKRINAEDFICVVEITKGSKKKYELDKETTVNEVSHREEWLKSLTLQSKITWTTSVNKLL